MKSVEKFFLFLVLSSFLLPSLCFAQGAVGLFFDWIVGAITYLPSLIIIIVIQLAVLIAAILAQIFGGILLQVVRPDFISWSYTNRNNNPVIDFGLRITQGFVSIGLILALIYIAIATILRFAGYETKKLLINLLIVALLVNFAPLICGLIVDFTNIFMFYFTDKIGGLSLLWNVARGVAGTILRAFIAFRVTAQAGLIAGSFILIAYCIFYLFIVLAFVLLFMFRHVAIWIAVILSPIAFICWILPGTRKYWDFWWNNFLQWALLGPIIGFFLYMGSEVAKHVNDQIVPGLAARMRNIFIGAPDLANIFPHLISLGFLYLGFVLGMQGGAIGAQMITGWARKGINYFQKSPVWQRPMGWAAGKVSDALAWGSRPFARLGQGLEKRFPKVGPLLSEILTTYPSKTAMGFAAYATRTRQVSVPKEFESLSLEEQEKLIKILSSREKIFYAQKAAQIGTLQKMHEDAKKRLIAELDSFLTSPYYKKQLKDIFQALPEFYTKERAIRLAINPPYVNRESAEEIVEKDIRPIFNQINKEVQRNPDLHDEIANIAKNTKKTMQEVMEDIAAQVSLFSKMKPSDIRELSKDSVKSLGFRLALLNFSPSQLSSFIENFDRSTVEDVLTKQGSINQLFEAISDINGKQKLLEELYSNNPSLIRWFFVNPVGRILPFGGREVIEKNFNGNFYAFEKQIRELSQQIKAAQQPPTPPPPSPPPPPPGRAGPGPTSGPSGRSGIGPQRKTIRPPGRTGVGPFE